MTISSTTRQAGPYAGNDVTTVFPFTFKVFAAADLLVAETDAAGSQTVLTLTTDYSVALNADQNVAPGGNVTRVGALPTGYELLITSDVAGLQPVNLTNAGGFYPRVINDALDRLTILAQQVLVGLGRALQLPYGETTTQLPSAAERASKVLGFDATGAPVAVTSAGAGAAAFDLSNVNPATGRTALGIASSGFVRHDMGGNGDTAGDFRSFGGVVATTAGGDGIFSNRALHKVSVWNRETPGIDFVIGAQFQNFLGGAAFNTGSVAVFATGETIADFPTGQRNHNHVGLWASLTARNKMGTNGVDYGGALAAGNFSVYVETGALNIEGANGAEFNPFLLGGNVRYLTGLSTAPYLYQAADVISAHIWHGQQGGVPMDFIQVLTDRNSGEVLDNHTILYGTAFATPGVRTARRAFDFRELTFTEAVLETSNGLVLSKDTLHLGSTGGNSYLGVNPALTGGSLLIRHAAGAGVTAFQGGNGQPELTVASQSTSAVNYFRIDSKNTGGSPTLSALGTDANIDVVLTPKGTGVVRATGPVTFPPFTVATAPSAAAAGAGANIYVTNESGGAVVAFSDATNWRRVTDRAIIS